MLPDRFWAKVDKDPDGCWLWTAATTQGYGVVSFGGVLFYAHRAAWEDANGPVPDGLQLDHLCRVRVCCRPDHLEPVTLQVNVKRGVPYRPRATECRNGHSYAVVGVYVNPADGRRRCVACRRSPR